ncbi:MAG: hypothetical protein WCS92_05365 [Candidatus Babeliales bacterium]|jgi:hypothetical protein
MKILRVLLGLFVIFIFQKPTIHSMRYAQPKTGYAVKHGAALRTLPRAEELYCYILIQKLLDNPTQEEFDQKKGCLTNACKQIIEMIERKSKYPQTSEDERDLLRIIQSKLQAKLNELIILYPGTDIDRLVDLFARINI